MTTGFRRHSQGGRFKNPSSGDLGISALRERDQTIIDSLQLARSQQAEIDKDQLSSMERAFDLERQNVADLQALEDKIYNRQLKNIEVRSQRDIEAIKGRADEYQRQAEHWETLAPKLSQAFTQLASGYKNVTHNLGYAQALKNQADNDTLQIWAKNFEEGVTIADEELLETKKQLKEAGATDSQLFGLDSTSVFYKAGRVSYITDDLIANIDTHIKEGLQAYKEEFGINPATPEELNRAYKWIQNKIEKSIGIERYKYHKGVIKFRNEFNKAAARKSNTWTSTRNAEIFKIKYQENLDIFEADPSQDKMDRLIQFVELHGVDKEGNPIANNTAQAIEHLFTSWASDLTISDDELLERLRYLTPPKGRQKGDAGNGYDLAQIGGRNPKLFEKISETRATIKRKKLNDFKAAKDWDDRVALGEAIDFTLNKWDGNIQTIENKIEEANANGRTEAANHYKKFLDAHGIGLTGVKGIKREIDSLIDNGDHQDAYRMIENSSVLSAADKREYTSQLAHIVQFEKHFKINKLNESLEALLKKELGYKGDDDLANASVAIKLTDLKNDFWTSFRVELDKTANVKTAYINAIDTVEKLVKDYEVIPARSRGKGYNFPVFASTLRQLDDGNIPEYQKIDYTRKELSSPGFDWVGLLNETEKKVISDSKRDKWIKDINDNRPLEFYSTVDEINRDLPSDHPLKGSPELIIAQLLNNTGDEKAIEAAKKIRPDNGTLVTNVSRRANFRKKMQNAHSNRELSILASLEAYTNITGQLPVNPKVQAVLDSQNLAEYLSRWQAEYGEIPEEYVIWQPDGRAQVTDFGARKTLIENGRRWGIHYAPDGYFYIEDN